MWSDIFIRADENKVVFRTLYMKEYSNSTGNIKSAMSNIKTSYQPIILYSCEKSPEAWTRHEG